MLVAGAEAVVLDPEHPVAALGEEGRGERAAELASEDEHVVDVA